MIAIITEKPSVARDIAKVLGVVQKKDGYIEGNGYMITWAYGHLVSLALPEEYGFTGKAIEDLPIIPEDFLLVPRKIKTKEGYKTDTNASKQLNVIESVFNKCSRIIVATDAGREGELIFRFIYKYLKCKKPFSRLWISSMTDKAIKEGFENLKDGKDYDSLFLAAEARSQADWLLGINASRALHICSGESNNSLGRVQTPTLALICKRYLENKRFKSQPYWQTSINVSKDGIIFRVTGVDQYFEKEAADKAFNKIKPSSEIKVLKFSSEEKRVESPLLHDLASLQKKANIKHGFSANRTLSIAQKLYESKLISYPRTGSKYIPEDVFDTIPLLIQNLTNHPQFKNVAEQLSEKKLNKRSVNADKVTDHHALIITENKPEKLADDEKIIYELIAGRLLEAFSEYGINNSVKLEVACSEQILTTQQASVKLNGWRDVFNEKDEQNSEEDQQLPISIEGDLLKMESLNLIQKSTKPKALYTEASLLTAMETAGRDSNDKEIKTVLSNSGIGTPATRAAIIETLYTRDYICLQNKSLIPTKKGLELYKQIVNLQLADVELTGGWEDALLKIEKDPQYLASFIGGLKVFTKQVVTELASVISKTDNCNESPYICPKCKLGKIIIWPKMGKCNYSKCNFKLYREICGKMLNDNTVKSLLLKRKTPLIKGFKNKEGKKFDAHIILDENNNIKFEFNKK